MEESENVCLEKVRVLEVSECAAHNRLVASNDIEWKDEPTCALLNRKKHILWACENYVTGGTSDCAFAMCH